MQTPRLHPYRILCMLFLCLCSVTVQAQTEAEMKTRAKNNGAAGFYELGMFYLNEKGQCYNPKKAFKSFKKAHKKESLEATYMMYRCYDQGVGVKRDSLKGVICLSEAARKGEPRAELRVGQLYMTSTKDTIQAVAWFQRAAKHGNVEGQYAYAECLLKGWGIKKNEQEAYAWFLKAANAGHAAAQREVGKFYEYGLGSVIKNCQTAIDWYEKAAAQDDGEAMYRLACIYYYGDCINVDYKSSYEWVTRSVEVEYEEAYDLLAEHYFYGHYVEQSYEIAVKYYIDAVERRVTTAYYHLAICYQYGYGVTIDLTKAFTLYMQAAICGYVPAQRAVGIMYYEGWGCVKSYEQAVVWLQLAASAYDVEACYYLANCYYYGYGVTKSYVTAVKYYTICYEHSHVEGSYMLGVCYYYGYGVTKSYTMAVKCFVVCQAHSHIEGTYMLANCYYYGYGVAKNYKTAVKYYLICVDKEHVGSQYMLGLCYYYGYGVIKSVKIGTMWIERASVRGYVEATTFIERHIKIRKQTTIKKTTKSGTYINKTTTRTRVTNKTKKTIQERERVKTQTKVTSNASKEVMQCDTVKFFKLKSEQISDYVGYEAEVAYPVAGPNKTVVIAIRNWIDECFKKNEIGKVSLDIEPQKRLEQLKKQVMSEYTGDSFGLGTSISFHIKYHYQNKSVVTMSFFDMICGNCTHDDTDFVSFRISDGKRITYDDIFSCTKAQLLPIAKKYAEDWHNIVQGRWWLESYDSSNLYSVAIYEGKVLVKYNYNDGTDDGITVAIPLSAIKSYLKPGAEALITGKTDTSNKQATTSPQESIMTVKVGNVSFRMIRVDGGTFTMGATAEQGSDAADDEKPAHRVTLSTYYMGETEVTQELWQAVMGSNPSEFKGPRRPVEQVSWEDCQDFIRKLNARTGKNFRLPTEAEWEYAARGGNKSRGYKYAGSNKLGDVAWYGGSYDGAFYGGNSGEQTHNVATKRANELGLYDMSGNVFEWCQDWYSESYYSSSPQTNPTGPSSGSHRVCRGGSWVIDDWDCRVSNRLCEDPTNDESYALGLRLALTP